MYPLYKDIREKLGTPNWIDQHGVPRYCEFNPKVAAFASEFMTNNIEEILK